MKSLNIVKKLLPFLPLAFVCLILFSTLRGHYGNPSVEELNSKYWTNDGPFELSPDRGRFALTHSFVEQQSVHFNTDIARFAAPDLGYFNGKYVSLFAPGLSFLVIPGYLLGKYFGAVQVGTYAVVAFFALLNFWLVVKISQKMGASFIAGVLGATAFLFATPAFPYAVSLYQHHISTFLILISLYALMLWKDYKSLLIVWLACALSISIDYPNLFLMLPIGIYSLTRIVTISDLKEKLNIKIKFWYILTFVVMIPALAFFFWFNTASYGSPTQLAGTVLQVKEIDGGGNPVSKKQIGKEDESTTIQLGDKVESRGISRYFLTRAQLNGFFILLFSPDRGLVSFAPIMVFGFFALGFLLYKKVPYLELFLSIVVFNLIIYAMWGDVWGGWAFGSRYSIPFYSLLSICVSLVISRYKKTYWLIGVFLVLFSYSSYINTVGALTSNSLPPKVEVLSLEAQTGIVQKYTYERNTDMLSGGFSKSFVYNHWVKNFGITTWQYFSFIYLSIMLLVISCVGVLFARSGHKEEEL